MSFRKLPPALFAVVGGIVAKCWLIAGSQIIDGGDDPHEYVNQILHPANEGVAYPPGTGLVGRLFYETGLPFRWGIEILFILAVALVLKALFDWPWKNYLSAGLFLFLLFDPAPAYLFSTFMSDQIWLVETMFGFALLVLALEPGERPRWWLMALGAIFLGLSAITRSTVAPLLLDVAALALVSSVLLLAKERSARLGRSVAVLSLALWTLLLGIGCIYGATCWYGYRCFGYAGISALDSTEYKTFFFCLQSVGEPTGVKYFPIDEDRRRLIARAGPISHWFIDEIEKEEALKEVGWKNYGRRDFPTGWFHFAAFDVVLKATHGNLRNAFVIFDRIEREISSAGRRGIIPVRFVLPLPDSRLAIILPEIPQAWRNTVDEIVFEPPPEWRQWQTGHASYLNPDFDLALHRRRATESPAQETAERLLGDFYTVLYRPFMVGMLGIFVAAFLILLGIRWKRIATFSLPFLARQSFLLTFLVMMGWYTLFDASGLPVLSRYMMFNHLMLPVLIAYYLVRLVRLWRERTAAL